MITKDTSLYSDLFKKANKLLELEGTENEIKDIDSYFRNLGNLRDKMNETTIDPLFFILPVDEDMFEINANTRSIKIPDAFKNGISVQGDQIAETIYFSIDRYFDTTDFYDDNIIPVIQWKYADEIGEGAYHLSATTPKAIMADQNSNTGKVKVVFGWPISEEVTEKAKNIQFGVRFYSIIDENGNIIDEVGKYGDGTLDYSFSTLNAVTKINPGLAVDIISGNYEYIDKNYLIYKRMRNSKPADINLQAILPIIEYLIPNAGSIADLDEETKTLTLKTKVTYPSGTAAGRIGTQIYEIMRIDYNGEESLVATASASGVLDDLGEPFQVDYIETKDTERNSWDVYYIKETAEDGTENYVEYNDTDWPTSKSNIVLYEKVYTIEIDKAGKYYVRITNQIDTNNKETNQSKTFEISLPSTPTVGTSGDNYNIVLEENKDDEGIGLGTYKSVILQLTTTDTDEGIGLTYKWYRAEDYTQNKEEMVPLSEDYTSISSYEASEPGYYYLEAANERNNSFAYGINNTGIRVSYPATAPTLKYYVGKYEMTSEQLADKIIFINTILRVEASADRADNFIYAWYKEGNSAVISNESSFTIPSNSVGDIYYCEVTSVYNVNSKVSTKSVSFEVVS